MTAPIYIALVHYPIVNKHGALVTTALTNFDVHDLARTSRTFGVDQVFLITPIEAQRKMADFIKEYWSQGLGATINPDRKEAFTVMSASASIEETCLTIQKLHGSTPRLVATSAKRVKKTVGYTPLREQLQTDTRPYLFLFGTGWGLAPEVFDQVDLVLEPILGVGDYNHLPVRSAVAIILDRLFGQHESNV